MTEDTEIKLCMLMGAIMITGFVVVFFWAIFHKDEASEVKNQYYETSVAQWQAPPVYEITQYVLRGVMANGQEVHKGAVACPRDIKLGVRVEIGGIEYTCEDRTHLKWDGTFDIWQSDYQLAKEWGRKIMIVKIYDN